MTRERTSERTTDGRAEKATRLTRIRRYGECCSSMIIKVFYSKITRDGINVSRQIVRCPTAVVIDERQLIMEKTGSCAYAWTVKATVVPGDHHRRVFELDLRGEIEHAQNLLDREV